MRANGRPGKGPKGKAMMRPKYRGREELPVIEMKFAEADGRYYGSGRAVFDILTAPITLVLPWQFVGLNPHPTIRSDERKEVVMALRKLEQGVASSQSRGVNVADAGAYPQVLEYLASDKYPDGSSRQTSSLVIVSDGQAWRVCLSDKDNQRVMWKTGATLVEALEAIELALMADDPSDWRRSAEASGKRRK